jgi:hypothetical protein
MNVRPGTEEFMPKNVRPMVTPYRPRVGMTVPKDGRLLHRAGKAIKDADGLIIGRKGEQVKLQRETVCGLRDAMAKASSSAKTRRFLACNEKLDRRLDVPAVIDDGHGRGGRRKHKTHGRLAARVLS